MNAENALEAVKWLLIGCTFLPVLLGILYYRLAR